MKKIILFSLLIFISLLSTVGAVNLEISVEPSDILVDDSVTITCWYSGNTTNVTLSTPWAYIGRTSWNQTLNGINDTHFEREYTPPSPLLGTYDVFCSNGILDSPQTSFRLSNLTLTVPYSPDLVYLGDSLEIHAKLVETSDSQQPITSNVNFEVYLDGENILIDPDKTYPSGEEWVITTEDLSTSDFDPSSYTLTLDAIFREETISYSKNVEVRSPVEFELITVDKTEVLPGDIITVTFRALERGNPIPPQDLQSSFQIGGEQSTILNTTQTGNNINVVISVPSLSPGSYDMFMEVIYDSYVWEPNPMTIDYGVPVTVDIKDSDGNAVTTQFRFLVNGIEKKKFITGSEGLYSGFIPPGIYDIEIVFPNSKLNLYDIMINDFDNPIRFDNPSVDVNILGVGVGDIHVFEVALSYSDVYLEFKYDSSKIPNENDIIVHKCENWNFGGKLCSEDWETIDAEIDTVRDLVKINTSSLSAFLVGYKKEMGLNFNTDKDEYYLKHIIKVTGIVEDVEGKPVPDAQITASISGTEISASGVTDNAGVFAFEFIGPDQEGSYDISIEAEKSPFSTVKETKTIKIVKSSQLSLLIPEGIRATQGESSSVWISIVNIGQTDFPNLILSLSGIPEGYYNLPSEMAELKAGEKTEVSLDFMIPDDAGKTSYTGKLGVTHDEITLEEQFILTVLSSDKNKTTTLPQNTEGFKFPSLGLPTGNIVLPTMDSGTLALAISTVFIFSFAVLFKKKKITVESERSNVKNLLLDIKREVERPIVKENRIESVKKRMKRFRKTIKKRKTK